MSEWGWNIEQFAEICQLAGINELIRITTYKGNVRKDEAMAKFDTLL